MKLTDSPLKTLWKYSMALTVYGLVGFVLHQGGFAIQDAGAVGALAAVALAPKYTDRWWVDG